MKRIIRRPILLLIAGLTFVSGPGIRRLLSGRDEVAALGAGSRVLVLRLDLLGDVVFSLSAIRSLKQALPDVEVSVVTLPGTAPVARHSPDVAEVIALDTNLVRSIPTVVRMETWKHLSNGLLRLRAHPYTRVLSLYGRTASLVGMFARGGERIGYRSESYLGALDRVVDGGRVAPSGRRHDVDYSAVLVDELTGRDTAPQAPNIQVTAEERVAARRLLRDSGLGSGTQFVVFHVGSTNGEFKRWPAAHFAAVARRLSDDGVVAVIVGTPSEMELARQITAASPAVSLVGATTIGQLMALLADADLVISGDSGPLHLATALGTRAIGVYGPTDPLVTGPIGWAGQEVRVLRSDIACSPCYSVTKRAECPFGAPICMRLVDPGVVTHYARAILSGRRVRPSENALISGED